MITNRYTNEYLDREFIEVICAVKPSEIQYDFRTVCPDIGQNVPGMPNIEIHLGMKVNES